MSFGWSRDRWEEYLFDRVGQPLANAVVYQAKGKTIAKVWSEQRERFKRIAQKNAGVDDAEVMQSGTNYVTNLGGGKVYVAKGDYYINDSILIQDFGNYWKLVIKSNGAKLIHSANVDIFRFSGYVRFVEIEGFHLLSDRSKTGRAFYFDCDPETAELEKYAAFITIKNCRIDSFLEGAIYAKILWMSNFINLDVRRCGDADHNVVDLLKGTNYNSSHDINFERCWFENNNDAQYVVHIEPNCYNINFDRLYAENAAKYNIYCWNGSYYISIKQSRFADATEVGVRLGSYSCIENSHFTNLPNNAIELGYRHNSVIGCHIGATNCGVLITNDYNIVANNPYISGDRAVKISYATKCKVIGNILKGDTYEVEETGTADYNIIKNNHLLGSGTISTVGTNTVVADNL